MSDRLFAVIPAAGHSHRMGRPKLLLPYQDTTVIGQMLSALMHPRIVTRCVVVRRADSVLKTQAEQHGAWVIQPDDDPPDMRASVEFALRAIAEKYQPDSDDGWLLIPADHPLLSADLLNELITVWQSDRPRILVPTHHGHRGHPVLFRWNVVEHVASIPAARGLNWLLEQYSNDVLEWPCEFAEITQDLDTPDDYQKLIERRTT